jgi:hypothetical protein
MPIPIAHIIVCPDGKLSDCSTGGVGVNAGRVRCTTALSSFSSNPPPANTAIQVNSIVSRPRVSRIAPPITAITPIVVGEPISEMISETLSPVGSARE